MPRDHNPASPDSVAASASPLHDTRPVPQLEAAQLQEIRTPHDLPAPCPEKPYPKPASLCCLVEPGGKVPASRAELLPRAGPRRESDGFACRRFLRVGATVPA